MSNFTTHIFCNTIFSIVFFFEGTIFSIVEIQIDSTKLYGFHKNLVVNV